MAIWRNVQLWLSWFPWYRRQAREADLTRELRDHLDLEADEQIAAGLPPEEAAYAAHRALGNTLKIEEDVRAAWGFQWLETLFQDLRYGLRMLRKSPGFTAVAVLTLALGIGANTAIFSLIYGVILKQLPISNPHELYRIGEGEYYCCEWGGLEGSWGTFDYPYYKHLRDTNPAFEQLAAFSGGTQSFNVRLTTSSGPAQTINAEYISGNYFSTLGIRASLGRLVSPFDDKPESPATAVMGYRAWKERYGSDPSMIGSTILVNNLPVTLVGITPQGFFGDRLNANPPELWIPLNQEPTFEGEGQKSILNSSGMAWLYMIGRLKPGVSPTQLQTQLSMDLRQWLRSERQLNQDDLAELPKQHIQVTTGGAGISSFRSNSTNALYLLSAASLLVLLIACANLANLLLARSTARQHQTALRLALGASRSRLVRAMLTESVLLSVIGGAAGLVFAYAGTKAILLIVFRGTRDVPVNASPSLPVLGFALLLSVLTGVIFGIAPGWIGTRGDVLKGLRSSRVAAHHLRPQRTLVALQAALSIVLLAVAGLVTQSLRNLEKKDLGFQTQGRLLADINFKAAGYEPERLLPLYEQLQRRLEQIPGVRSASLSLNSPQDLCCINLNVVIGGRTDKWIEGVNVVYNRVSPRYFETIGTPLLRGRAFDEHDVQTSQHVAVVDETFARKFFPNEDAIGKSFGLSLPGHGYDYQIVGIVKDAKYKNPTVRPSPTLFLPFTQTTQYKPSGYQRLETATHYAQSIQLSVVGSPQQYEKAFLNTLAAIDPNLSVIKMTSYAEQVAIQFNQERLIARLIGLFSLLALALASVGLYGVTAYNVARRTNEIGTRMALGADRSHIVSMVIRSAFSQVGIGLCIGLPLAMLIGRYLAHQLYEVGQFDPLVLGGSTIVLCACAVIAALIPARRAASVDPMVALRYE